MRFSRSTDTCTFLTGFPSYESRVVLRIPGIFSMTRTGVIRYVSLALVVACGILTDRASTDGHRMPVLQAFRSSRPIPEVPVACLDGETTRIEP